jgi:hypothetical protein
VEQDLGKMMKDPLSIYAPSNRIRMLVTASLPIVAIATVDCSAIHYISLATADRVETRIDNAAVQRN